MMLKAKKIMSAIDRWGTCLLVFLVPWQARIIFKQGYLAGAPSESGTVSLFALELLILFMVIVRFVTLSGGKGHYALRAVGKSFIAMAAVVLLSFFSVIVSYNPVATIFTSVHLLEGMALFFLIVTAPCEREARIAFIASAVVQVLIAVAEMIYGRIPASTWLGVAAVDPAAGGASVIEAGGMRLLRAYGTLPHPNIFGGMLAAAILFARPLFRRMTVASVAVYSVLAVGVFLSFSRLAWIALLVGFVVQAVFALRDRFAVTHFGVVAAVFIMMAALFNPFLTARVTATGRLEEKSMTTRVQTFRDAWEIVKLRPLAGAGAGAFAAAVHESVDPDRGAYGYETAHSVFALSLAELGVFGLALYLILFYWLSLLAWGSGKPGLAAALIVFAAAEHWPISTFAGVMIFFAAWGLSLRGRTDGKVTRKSGAIIISERDPSKILLLYREGRDYSDWTFPKGHMEAAESYEETMRREVWEETGLIVDIVKRLPDREYVTGHGHDAISHFFLVRSLDDSKLRLEPGHPGNKLEWLSLDEAAERLTFDNPKQYFRRVLPEIRPFAGH